MELQSTMASNTILAHDRKKNIYCPKMAFFNVIFVRCSYSIYFRVILKSAVILMPGFLIVKTFPVESYFDSSSTGEDRPASTCECV